MTIDVKLGEHKRVAVRVVQQHQAAVVEAPGRGKLYGGIALTGAGTLAVGIGIAVAIAARADYTTGVTGHCMDGVCDPTGYQLTNDARSRANTMTVVTIGGSASRSAPGCICCSRIARRRIGPKA